MKFIFTNKQLSKNFYFVLFFLLVSCQSQTIDPFIEAKNPYAQLGVEGYMGAVMTSCLGKPPQGPPIRRKKDGATVIADDHHPEQSSYFDCVDREIYKSENRNKKDSN